MISLSWRIVSYFSLTIFIGIFGIFIEGFHFTPFSLMIILISIILNLAVEVLIQFKEQSEKQLFPDLENRLDRIIDLCQHLKIRVGKPGEIALEVIWEEPKLIEKYEYIKNSANTMCKLVWCGKYTGLDVQKYFTNEKLLLERKEGFKLIRLININDGYVPKKEYDIHNTIMKDPIINDKYECHESDVENFEIVYGDYSDKGITHFRALLVLLNDNKNPKLGFYFDSDQHPTHKEIINTINRIFAKEYAEALSKNKSRKIQPKHGIIGSIKNKLTKKNTEDLDNQPPSQNRRDNNE